MINQQDIQNIYQQHLGRMPTSGETASFMQYANNGSVPLTTFDIGQIVQGTPEYQQQQLQRYGGQYQDVLGASDQRLLGIAQNALTGQFASQGRNIGSSGYLNAFANTAANLATARQQQLAQFYGGGYQNLLGLAAGQGNAAQGNAISQQNSTLGWDRAKEMYTRQLNDYQNWVNSQNRGGFTRALEGAAVGGAGGALSSLFGPSVSAAGSNLASSLFGGGGGGGGLFGGGQSYAPSGYTPGYGGYGGFQGTQSAMRTGGY